MRVVTDSRQNRATIALQVPDLEVVQMIYTQTIGLKTANKNTYSFHNHIYNDTNICKIFYFSGILPNNFLSNQI
jgi:hypothetical protein